MKFISPCISICKSDPKTGFCYGCARTDEEKKIWKNPETTNSWKEENLIVLRNNKEIKVNIKPEALPGLT